MGADDGVEIVNTDRIDGEAVVVEFSDGTSITLTTEDLIKLRPDRAQPTEDATHEGDGMESAR